MMENADYTKDRKESSKVAVT